MPKNGESAAIVKILENDTDGTPPPIVSPIGAGDKSASQWGEYRAIGGIFGGAGYNPLIPLPAHGADLGDLPPSDTDTPRTSDFRGKKRVTCWFYRGFRRFWGIGAIYDVCTMFGTQKRCTPGSQ